MARASWIGQGLVVWIGARYQLVGVISAAQFGQVAQHIVDSPRIRQVLSNGGENAAVAVVRFRLA